MIQDAVTSGLSPKQPLVIRLAAVIEGATFSRRRRQGYCLAIRSKSTPGSEAWQQTVEERNGPAVTNTTVSEIQLGLSRR